MTAYSWPITLGQVTELTRSWPSGDAVTLVTWAIQAGHGLAYLCDLDEETFGTGARPPPSEYWQAVDLTHVRWASVTAVTTLDLAAAALGRLHLSPRRDGNELALADFFHRPDGVHLRSLLPPAGQAWVKRTWDDVRYWTVRRARHPFTHGRLRSNIYVSIGATRPHHSRTGFNVGPKGAEVLARDLIEMAFHVVDKRLGAFLSEIEAGSLWSG